MTPVFETELSARPEHIDELGHVNNVVWVQWLQDVATSHWRARAAPEHVDAFVWVIIRHEVDYLRPAFAGDRIRARTWVGDGPKGARFDRFIEFLGDDDKPRVRARTTWAMIDKVTGRPQRVTPQIIAPFVD